MVMNLFQLIKSVIVSNVFCFEFITFDEPNPKF